MSFHYIFFFTGNRKLNLWHVDPNDPLTSITTIFHGVLRKARVANALGCENADVPARHEHPGGERERVR